MKEQILRVYKVSVKGKNLAKYAVGREINGYHQLRFVHTSEGETVNLVIAEMSAAIFDDNLSYERSGAINVFPHPSLKITCIKKSNLSEDDY